VFFQPRSGDLTQVPKLPSRGWVSQRLPSSFNQPVAWTSEDLLALEYLNKKRMLKQDRPDVQIFMALLQSNLWRPSDSGRRIVLDWLHYVARTSLANCHSHGVLERREAFKSALAAEDTDVPRHPSQVCLSTFPRLDVPIMIYTRGKSTFRKLALRSEGCGWQKASGFTAPNYILGTSFCYVSLR
jgi:hypothetical protein